MIKCSRILRWCDWIALIVFNEQKNWEKKRSGVYKDGKTIVTTHRNIVIVTKNKYVILISEARTRASTWFHLMYSCTAARFAQVEGCSSGATEGSCSNPLPLIPHLASRLRRRSGNWPASNGGGVPRLEFISTPQLAWQMTALLRSLPWTTPHSRHRNTVCRKLTLKLLYDLTIKWMRLHL